jgi:uncharacterized membrane protein YdcZ (DUF606 family)
MQFSAISIANVVAWAVLVGLIGVAFVLVVILGPFGLILLGLAVLFVCTAMHGREDAPTSGTEVFRAQMVGQSSPEQRAALAEERERTLAPLKFYRWCGGALLVAGIAAFAWQQLH